MISTRVIRDDRPAATLLGCLAILHVPRGIVLSVMFGRATSAPLFWMASAGFAAAWYLQRRTAENQ
nr:hypothetical protein OG296_04305 [Streptomyces sp. NBC_01001]WSW63146.1 hypothetical protein OG513_33780 [Streptomyces sp. NBC_00998]